VTPLDRHQSGNVLYGMTAITCPPASRFVLGLSSTTTAPIDRSDIIHTADIAASPNARTQEIKRFTKRPNQPAATETPTPTRPSHPAQDAHAVTSSSRDARADPRPRPRQPAPPPRRPAPPHQPGDLVKPSPPRSPTSARFRPGPQASPRPHESCEAKPRRARSPESPRSRRPAAAANHSRIL
jgi:hypothetical protein